MMLVSRFEDRIGNTDRSLAKLHNIILVRASVMAVYDQVFKIIEKPGDAKRAFIDGGKRATR